jgi:hypothetical protein
VLALAIIFGVFAGFDWNRMPVLGRCSLADPIPASRPARATGRVGR